MNLAVVTVRYETKNGNIEDKAECGSCCSISSKTRHEK